MGAEQEIQRSYKSQEIKVRVQYRYMKTTLIVAAAALILIVGGMAWASHSAQQVATQEANNPDVISTTGIHWHPELTILVKGKPVTIPQNMGFGSQYASMRGYSPAEQASPIHTHEDVPRIHLEFANGPVYKEDVMLGQFFKVWGKDMRSFGSNMRMTVNGVPNTDYENYVMHDGDKIVLTFD